MFWLIGLLEGDGTFSYSGAHTPMIRIAMTDKDTVQRAADLMGCEVRFKKRGKAHYKDLFTATIGGFRAADLMVRIYSDMSMRRQEKIQSILANYSGPGHKLSRGDIREIREKYETGDYTQRKLADKYGVAQSLISGIINRKKWKSVE